jgi:hypothetical protein
MRYIAEHIKGHKEAGQGSKSYSVFFVPRRTMICERILEEEGVYQSMFNSHQIIPLVIDLTSLSRCHARRVSPRLDSVRRRCVEFRTAEFVQRVQLGTFDSYYYVCKDYNNLAIGK